MRIHAFQTGEISVKHNYYDAKGGNRAARLTSVLLDRAFQEIPIYVWVIEHPEGLIVIDAGESAAVNDPDYFPLWQRPYWTSQYRFHITPDDEIGAHLKRAGLSVRDVRWLVLTHTHFDHSDAINTFVDSEILITRKEHDDIYRYRSAHFGFPSKWSPALKQRVIDFSPTPVGTFSESYTLTRAGDVHLVPTPGHTMGHQSVILQHDGLTYFFGADTSFDQASLLNGTMDAPTFNAPLNYETREKILAYARQTPLIYLTTHDYDTPRRLAERATLEAAPQTV